MINPLKIIISSSSVPIPPFDLDGEQSDWYWFRNNGTLTESKNDIVINSSDSNGAIVYTMWNGDLSNGSHKKLSETFSRHPHIVAINEGMYDKNHWRNDWMKYCLTSIKVNNIIQKGYM